MSSTDVSGRITPTPTLGAFYTVQQGDTLLGVTGRAIDLGPGSSRLEAARIINDAEYNDRFRGKPNKFFPKGQLRFLPRFLDDPDAQASEENSAPSGHSLPTIWLAAHPGDEPFPDAQPEPSPQPSPAPQPSPTPDDEPPPAPRQLLDWETLHKGVSVKADKPLTVFLRPEVIPVIIVPGIAGSALEPTNPNDRWNGPGWPVNTIPLMLKILLRGPRGKRKNFIGRGRHKADYLSVIGQNDPRIKGNEEGLLGVAQLKYKALSHRLADMNERRKTASSQDAPPLRHFYFRTPPHAYGYNWTSDIAAAGKGLIEYIDSLGGYYGADGGRCERCILITHSTGGLVARSALQQDPSFDERVVAAFHGGVPHAGAAEAYFRMKCGFPQSTSAEKQVAWATMKNGDEAGAVLGNIPGGLQLLPGIHYRTNAGEKAWLELHFSDGEITRLPSGTLKEFYEKEEHAWALIDKTLLDPRTGAKPNDEFELWTTMMNEVVIPLHDKIQGVEFSNAVQIASHGLPTPDKVVLICDDDPAKVTDFLGDNKKPPHRRNKGEYQIVAPLESLRGDTTKWHIQIQPRSGDGDNTVSSSVASGSHSGTEAPVMGVNGHTHADMLMQTEVQWKILEQIETKLDGLIEQAES